MSGYEAVKTALKNGADIDMLCKTCPWDRNCVSAPEMTSEDIEREIKNLGTRSNDPLAPDEDSKDKTLGALFGTMIGTLTYAGKDGLAPVCPVFAHRLRTSEGKELNELLKQRFAGG